jgi:hypothetical protein
MEIKKLSGGRRSTEARVLRTSSQKGENLFKRRAKAEKAKALLNKKAIVFLKKDTANAAKAEKAGALILKKETANAVKAEKAAAILFKKKAKAEKADALLNKKAILILKKDTANSAKAEKAAALFLKKEAKAKTLFNKIANLLR